FQAEDGIRGRTVTGVQTCALPIWSKTYPDPVDHCRICRWIDVCELRRRQDDHLCLVAGMRRDQTRRLQLAGIPTMAALAASPSEIGRASCRERVESPEHDGIVKKK